MGPTTSPTTEETPGSPSRAMVTVVGFGPWGEGCLRQRELKRAEVYDRTEPAEITFLLLEMCGAS